MSRRCRPAALPRFGNVQSFATVKGGKLVYGYKIHSGVDLEHGFILGGHVTGANVSDTRELPQVVEECHLSKGARIETDKGYAGEPNRRFLEDAGYDSGIMRRGKRNQCLSLSDKIWNATISKTRWVVERSFGILKKVQGFT